MLRTAPPHGSAPCVPLVYSVEHFPYTARRRWHIMSPCSSRTLKLVPRLLRARTQPYDGEWGNRTAVRRARPRRPTSSLAGGRYYLRPQGNGLVGIWRADHRLLSHGHACPAPSSYSRRTLAQNDGNMMLAICRDSSLSPSPSSA
jgi:hypothetical protein